MLWAQGGKSIIAEKDTFMLGHRECIGWFASERLANGVTRIWEHRIKPEFGALTITGGKYIIPESYFFNPQFFFGID